jgi:hypothetical protein
VWPCTRRSAISSRSANERYRPESGFADSPNITGGMPPAFRNHLVPTACGTPAPTAAFSLDIPAAIAAQNRRHASRPATAGRPGDNKGARPDRSVHRFRLFIATSFLRVLRRPLESALCTAMSVVGHFQNCRAASLESEVPSKADVGQALANNPDFMSTGPSNSGAAASRRSLSAAGRESGRWWARCQ